MGAARSSHILLLTASGTPDVLVPLEPVCGTVLCRPKLNLTRQWAHGHTFSESHSESDWHIEDRVQCTSHTISACPVYCIFHGQALALRIKDANESVAILEIQQIDYMTHLFASSDLLFVLFL